MAAQGALGTDFYDRSIFRPNHRAYYRSGRPVIKIGLKGAMGSHENRSIHYVPRLGQSIVSGEINCDYLNLITEWNGYSPCLSLTCRKSLGVAPNTCKILS